MTSNKNLCSDVSMTSIALLQCHVRCETESLQILQLGGLSSFFNHPMRKKEVPPPSSSSRIFSSEKSASNTRDADADVASVVFLLEIEVP